MGVLLWCSRLSIRCCHCYGLDHCCGTGSIPDLGTSKGCECRGRKKKKKKEKNHIYVFKVFLERKVGKEPVKKKFFFFSFLAAPWHMECLGQGSDPSHSCDLCCSWQHQILNPLCQAKDSKLFSCFKRCYL